MSDFANKEKYEGIFCGESVRFNRVWSGHRFTDDECERLCNGEEITVTGLVGKSGKPYGVVGKLTHQTYNGHPFVGFERTGFANTPRIPDTFCGHDFTDREKLELEAGTEIYCDGLVSKKGSTFNAYISYGEKEDGSTGLILRFE